MLELKQQEQVRVHEESKTEHWKYGGGGRGQYAKMMENIIHYFGLSTCAVVSLTAGGGERNLVLQPE